MNEIYQFGPFRLDATVGVLEQDGTPTTLGPRGVAVLAALLRQPGRCVTKDALLDAAWADVVVQENSLAVQISALRRVLARSPGGERWVRTVARRGYVFDGPVPRRDLDPPAAPRNAVPFSNLSEPLTSFVGRERELVAMRRLLPTTRLLTVIGAGGIGKTRLALQCAAEIRDAYRDGVCLVELAPLNDPALVPSAVAQALDVREVPGRPLIDTLCRELKGRELLLLLDNCEHLADAGATLAHALLANVADLTILATSREALRVPGEQAFPLAPLSLPDPAGSTGDVARAEAVQLFLARARNQQPDFVLTPERTRVVAELCIRLDGIPLALELAAARLRSLPLEQIFARLDDRFRLLADGPRTALPKQRTLRATLDWSYDLLTEVERTVLRRLGVFAGGFALEAARSVAADNRNDADAVTEAMAQLVGRSLVSVDAQTVHARYRLLETMRAYALERLGEAGETADVMARHLAYYAEALANANDDWLTLGDLEWRRRYAPEVDNVRAALDRSLGAGRAVEPALRLCGVTAMLWQEFGLRDEGRQRLLQALAFGDGMPPAERAQLWLRLGNIHGDAETLESLRAFEHAITLYREAGDAPNLGYALAQYGFRLAAMDRFDEAMATLDEVVALKAGRLHPRTKARCAEFQGFLVMRRGDPAGALSHYDEALAIYRGIGLQKETLRALANKADLIWTLGDPVAAAEGFREAVALLRLSPLATRRARGWGLANLCGVLTELGDLEGARDAADEGLALLSGSGLSWQNMDHFGLRVALAGHLADAARLAAHADAEYARRQASRGPNETRARTRLAALLRDGVAPDELARLAAEGVRLGEADACRIAIRR